MNTVYFTIFLIIVTIIFIGFFSGMELAFVTANRLSIELKKKQGKSSGIILSKFMEEYRTLHCQGFSLYHLSIKQAEHVLPPGIC